MSRLLDQYRNLSSELKGQASTVFDAIRIAVVGDQLDSESRKTLAQFILDDLRAALLDSTISRLSPSGSSTFVLPLIPFLYIIITDAPQALSTLKSLGGTDEVASVLAISSNLRCLLRISAKIDDSMQNDALRCIANTVLLNVPARVTFVSP